MFHKPDFLKFATESLKAEYFASTPIAEAFAQTMIDFHKKYPDDKPSNTLFYDELRTRVQDKRIKQNEIPGYTTLFETISGPLPSDATYVEEAARQYASRIKS